MVLEEEREFMPPLDKVVSLSIDQVDSNPDGLIDLRGEGRYFGLQDDPSTIGPLCANCHQPGHKRAQCKTVVCRSCGVVDDHYTERCPKAMTCYNCGERGHYGNMCTQRSRRLYCQTCESTRHMDNRCPSIWRSYLTKNNSRKSGGLPTNMFCYNCSDKGHYGDDCPLPRASRLPNFDGSAFSGHNLPQGLRDVYKNVQKKRKRDDGYKRDDNKHSNGISKNKKNLLDKVKNVFKKDDKKGDYRNNGNNYGNNYGNNNNGGNNNNNNNNNKRVHKAQSMPVIRKTGYFDNNRRYELPAPSRRGQFRDDYDYNLPRASHSGRMR